MTTLVHSTCLQYFCDQLCRFGVVHVMFAVLSALSVMFSLFLGVHVSEHLG